MQLFFSSCVRYFYPTRLSGRGESVLYELTDFSWDILLVELRSVNSRQYNNTENTPLPPSPIYSISNHISKEIFKLNRMTNNSAITEQFIAKICLMIGLQVQACSQRVEIGGGARTLGLFHAVYLGSQPPNPLPPSPLATGMHRRLPFL